MEYKKSIIIIMLAVFLFSIAGVCARGTNDMAIASENIDQMELPSDNEITEDNLKTSVDNAIWAQENGDENVSAETDLQTLSKGEGTFYDLRDEIDEISVNDDSQVVEKSDDVILAVENDLDELSANPTNPSTFSELSREISSGGQVELEHDYYSYDGNGYTIYIYTPNTVINGKGAVIDMAGSNILPFHVDASGVTFQNLTIKNANCDREGGAIFFVGSGTVTNCNFTNNSAAFNSGAIKFYGAATVENCSFTNNRATEVFSYGGAIGMRYGSVKNCNFVNNSACMGAGAIEMDSAIVENCNFVNNAAGDENGGGAIEMYSGTVTNCYFTNNSARYGGAIKSFVTGTVTNCNFTNNKATVYDSEGGAICMASGSVENCNFINNTATCFSGAIMFGKNATVTNCNFTNNSAEFAGAIWFNSDGNVTICDFTNNTASIRGGAICFGSSGSTHTVENCSFTNNRVTGDLGDGGAVCFIGEGNVRNCNFTNNTATYYGGAIFFQDSCTVENCSFTNNRVTRVYSHGGAVSSDIYCFRAAVENCNFTNNTACDDGGAIYIYSGNVENCNFINNKATGCETEGGAIYMVSGTVENCNFVNNHANSGGAIYTSYMVTADTCIFKTDSDTTFSIGYCPPILNVDNFTAYYNSGEKLTFDLKTNSSKPIYDGNILISVYYKNNDSWVGNYSCLSGEGWTVDLPVGSYYAIFNTEYYGFTKISRTITIGHSFVELNYIINANDDFEVNLTNDYEYYPNCDGDFVNGIVISRKVTINGNGHTIDAKGKARAFNVQASDVTINNLTIINANNNNGGGAIYFNSSGTVENCNFTNNTAERGGALYLGCEMVAVINSYFADNDASSEGGALWLAGNGSVTGCNFANNTANRGGAIRISSNSVENCSFINNSASEGGAIQFDSDGTVANCSFADNTAKFYGGAVYFKGNGNAADCSFADNDAKYSGGALYFNSNGNAADCSFADNTAIYEGGAVYFKINGNLTDCSFADNTAKYYAGAVYFKGDANVTDCNFTDNHASSEGGAIWLDGSSYLANCNFANNRANIWGGAVRIRSGSVENCSFTNNSVSNGGAIQFDREGNVANCNFTDNAATNGSAVYFSNSGTVINCNFNGNNATAGSAIYFRSDSSAKTVSNSTFLNNRAEVDANAPLRIEQNGDRIEITFIGRDNLLNAIYSNGEVSFTNVTYWGVNGIMNTDDGLFNYAAEEAGQNIAVAVVVNDILILNETKVTNIDGKIILDIVAGNYTVNARHDTDSYYTYAEKTETFNIPGNETSLELSASEFAVTATITPDNLAGNVTFTVTNGSGVLKTVSVALNDGVAELNLTGLGSGEYGIAAAYKGNVDYCPSSSNISIIIRDDVPINVGDVSINYGEVADVIVCVPESINGQNITITVNGNSKNAAVVCGEAKAGFADLAAGRYEFAVDYLGDDYNRANSTTAKLTVNKASPEIIVSASAVDFGKDLTVTVQMPVDAARRPTVTIGDQSKAVTMRNGKGTVKFTGLAVGTYTVVASYNGDANYLKASANATAKVKPIPEIIVSANDVGYGSVLVVTVQMPADAARRPTVTIGDQSKPTMRNGIGTVKFTGLDVGTYDIVASYNGDADYGKASAATTAKVKPIPEITVSASDVIQGEDLVVTVQLPSDVTRRPTVTVGGESKLVTMRNGVGSVKFTGLALGTYSIDVSYSGDANYGKASIRTSVKVNRGPAEINVTANPVSYGEDVVIDVQLPSDVTRRVSIIVGNETKMVSLKNGSGSAKFSGLAVGTYDVSVEYAGDSKYLKSSQNTTVKVNKATPDIQITADDINYGKTLTVGIQLPSDVSRRATVKIDGVSKIVSLKNGVESVKFTDLSKGTHEVIVSYEGDANYNKASATTKINVN